MKEVEINYLLFLNVQNVKGTNWYEVRYMEIFYHFWLGIKGSRGLKILTTKKKVNYSSLSTSIINKVYVSNKTKQFFSHHIKKDALLKQSNICQCSKDASIGQQITDFKHKSRATITSASISSISCSITTATSTTT